MKEKNIKLLFKTFLCLSLLIAFCSNALAAKVLPPPPPLIAPFKVIPPPPAKVKLAVPRPGHVYVMVGGKHTLVPAPPGDAPYVWEGDAWVIAPPPAVEGYEWVPGYYSTGFWYPGHWAVLKAPGPGFLWTHGRWEGGVWIHGRWEGHGRDWAPGHRDKRGVWHRGKWGKPHRK